VVAVLKSSDEAPSASTGAIPILPDGNVVQRSAHADPRPACARSEDIPVPDTYPLEPAEAFALISSIKLADTGLDEVLGQIAELAKRSLPGASEVSVTLVRGRATHTAAFTGAMAVTLDEWQYEQNTGPCVDAATTATTLIVVDTAREPRWPGWASRALSAGVHSSLAVGLSVQESVAVALNIYATRVDAFDDDAVEVAETFAGYAGVALGNAHLYDATTSLGRHLRNATQSRAVIEQAKGIIMGQRRCSPDDAFAVLSGLSQQSNRKLRDVATDVVAGATRPPAAEASLQS
jgi:transcriptional regulator with GAF, ATPase, and Fis domain